MADDEIRKAFGELQMKMMDSKEKIKNNDLEILALKARASTRVWAEGLAQSPHPSRGGGALE